MKEGLPFFLTSGGHAVKIGFWGEQFCLIVHKIRIGVLVCNQVDRILQNRLDGEPGERTPGFCQLVHIIPDALCDYMGMKVLAVSCITNMATGIQTVKHSHARVLEIANQAGDTMCRWLGAVIQKM